jgi:RNA polymerase sigma-54 factor
MTLRQRLDQRQVQKLILAPALQQAIKLLPLTNLELIEVIDSEISQNPMIEIEGESQEQSPEEPDKPEETLAVPEAAAGEEDSGDGFEANFQEYLDDGFRPHFYEARETVSLENFLSQSPSLWDHLNWQAALTFHDEKDLDLARFIIGNINEDGYLTASEEEIANLNRTTPERARSIRKEIQAFDPIGSGSLDLRDALLSQMDSLQVQDEIARSIVTDHLALLEKSDYVQLARALNVPVAEVKDHLEMIKGLDPTPGRKYSEEKTTYVVPDIIVTKEGDEWTVTLNDEGLPRLRISQYYKRLLARAAQDQPDAHQFLKDRLKKALWFLRSLDQRNQTIYKVARYIVNKQKGFFERGIDDIRPLTLIEIAQDIGVHESTVGRVVANKHILTPQGVFPLKYFFHKSLPGQFGEDVSSLMIKDRIRKLVESEDPNHPLSDIEIGEILEKENLRIARRTVAKYRTQLKIEPSHIRKRKSIMEASS